MERVDVAVVGGGPAGSAAAHAAARQGAETIVFEKGVPREDRPRPGPDSTDAAGMLDYWVDLMNLPEEIPDDVILRDLSGAQFLGPTEQASLHATGMDASYPEFGFTFHRARFDDWLRERAESAGATYRTGVAVRDVDTDLVGGPTHTLSLRDGTDIQAAYLILADGPQRTVTASVLSKFAPPGVVDRLAAPRANHIAYQEHREFPEEVFDPDLLKFWWGVIPGHTAYPWVFPNDGTVARVGLTMPMNLDLDAVENPQAYKLLHPGDETIPAGGEYVRRLLEAEYGDEYDIETDFPLVEDRGKRDGVESYAISSTRPIDSPVRAGIAVVGGAMGATSAFHEGGDHVAVRTGKIAGALAGADAIEAYNREWKRAIGSEVRRNVTFADLVRGFEPSDWDRAFRVIRETMADDAFHPRQAARAGRYGAGLVARYYRTKFGYRKGRYVQITESEYVV